MALTQNHQGDLHTNPAATMQVSAQQDTHDNDVTVKPFADIFFGMLIHTHKKNSI